jgi:phenylacetate-CoA ligase
VPDPAPDLAPDRATLDPIEVASRDELAALQLTRLRWSLQHAYDAVPHYRSAFDAAGVAPGDLTELADLRHFPFTTKADLRANYPFGMFAVPREQVRRVHASSGTTGQPTVVGYTERDLSTWADVVARSIRAAGGRPGMTVHVAYGYGLFTGGLGAHYGAERLGCTVVPVSGGQTARQVRLITDFRPEVIMVTPSYMLALLDEFERQGLDPRQSSLRTGIFGAEPWTEDMRREVEERAGLHAVDIYGLSEVMGPGVASECVETKDGLHVWEDHFYPEVVDPETGAVLPDGEEGELVFTSLTKEAMPVVRYRTRDLTRLLPGTARTMRRMERITGRSDDMIILRGVNVFPTQVEELLLRVPGLSPHYQLVLSRPHRLDEMTVRVEARPDRAAHERAALAAQLCELVKESVGVTVACDVVEPATLQRSEGKAQRVLDLRAQPG